MNVYTKLGLDAVINASGRMTKLGISTVSDRINDAMNQAGKNYVIIDDLYTKAGSAIAKEIGAEDVVVTSSASSAIALSIASLICTNNLQKVKNFSDTITKESKREVILLKGHSIDFGAPISEIIAVGGGIVREVGYSNESSSDQVELAITENTLALMYVVSHHCVQKNMMTVEQMIEVGKRNNIPVIIDAAAEEDLSKYIELGADFVCYSGSKAISGPTSGFVSLSSKTLGDNVRLQYKGIGRVMKVGKEAIMGLVEAVIVYQENHGYIPVVTKEDLERFSEKVNTIDGLTSTIIQDEAGRLIFRSRIKVSPEEYSMNGLELVKELEAYNPKIYTRDYNANNNFIDIDVRPLKNVEELDTIYEALKRIGDKNEY